MEIKEKTKQIMNRLERLSLKEKNLSREEESFLTIKTSDIIKSAAIGLREPLNNENKRQTKPAVNVKKEVRRYKKSLQENFLRDEKEYRRAEPILKTEGANTCLSRAASET